MEHIITTRDIANFKQYLRREERAENTVTKYTRDVNRFFVGLEGQAATKDAVTRHKEALLRAGLSAVTVNAALAALHSFFNFMGWQDCRVRYLKVQRRVFRDTSRELTREEYRRLVTAAQGSGKRQLALVLETICATGIRVSELRFITLEAVARGRADIFLKGKVRTILIPGKLARKLEKFAQKQKITSGEIFLSAKGMGLSRRKIWADMKKLCALAGVDPGKVFPHNLRHLFARSFYRACRDIVRLADVLGHSSVETTRIYLVTTGEEHTKQLDRLGLVS